MDTFLDTGLSRLLRNWEKVYNEDMRIPKCAFSRILIIDSPLIMHFPIDH